MTFLSALQQTLRPGNLVLPIPLKPPVKLCYVDSYDNVYRIIVIICTRNQSLPYLLEFPAELTRYL